MNDTPAHRDASLAFLDMALEERLGNQPPPNAEPFLLRAALVHDRVASTETKARGGSRPLVAAVVLAAGIGVVFAVAIARRGTDSAARFAAQDPKPPAAASPASAAAHFPLALGNEWLYRQTTGDQTTGESARDVVVRVTNCAQIDGRTVFQLMTSGDGEPTWWFCSADGNGVRLHGSDSFTNDPLFRPGPADGYLLPSPVGAEATWTWRTLPPRRMPRGVGGFGGRTVAPVECKATLLGVGEMLRLGDTEQRAVHVQVDSDTPDGARVEHWHFVRGVGVALHTSRTGDGTEVRRELVRFTPALPAPDRDKVLAAALGDAAARCRWLAIPATEDAAWILRSQFAIETAADGVRIHRLTGDRVVPFDPSALADFAALATDEDLAPRMQGLFPQRAAIGLAQLCAHLRAATTACTVAGYGAMSAQIGANSSVITLDVTLADAAGARTQHPARVELKNGIPVDVTFGGSSATGR